MPVDREIESRRCVLFILIHVHFQPTEVGNEKEVKEVCTCTCICMSTGLHVCIYMYMYTCTCTRVGLCFL